MQPNGRMGLLPGTWKVWVGGTSPGTPQSLLRPAARSSTGNAKHYSGAPQAPLTAALTVTNAER